MSAPCNETQACWLVTIACWQYFQDNEFWMFLPHKARWPWQFIAPSHKPLHLFSSVSWTTNCKVLVGMYSYRGALKCLPDIRCDCCCLVRRSYWRSSVTSIRWHCSARSSPVSMTGFILLVFGLFLPNDWLPFSCYFWHHWVDRLMLEFNWLRADVLGPSSPIHGLDCQCMLDATVSFYLVFTVVTL